MRATVQNIRRYKVVVAACMLSGGLFATAAQGDPLCQAVSLAHSGLPCNTVSDTVLLGINGRGYEYRSKPEFQQAVILWDEVNGGQGARPTRVSVQDTGANNQQTNQLVFSPR